MNWTDHQPSENDPPDRNNPLLKKLRESGVFPRPEDLSEDPIKPSLPAAEQQTNDIRLQEWQHKQSLQHRVFTFGMRFAAFLYAVAAGIGFLVAYGFAIGTKTDWHLTLLAAAFIVPPTVIVTIMTRAIYPPPAQPAAAGEEVPLLNLIKEIKEMVVAVKSTIMPDK